MLLADGRTVNPALTPLQRAVAARAQRQRPPDDLFLGDSNRVNPRALRVHDGSGNPLGMHRPGPRYVSTGDAISDAAIGFNDAAEQAYQDELIRSSNAWRTDAEQQALSFQIPTSASASNQVQGLGSIGDYCTLDDGTRGIVARRGNKLTCVPLNSQDALDAVYARREFEDSEAWRKPPPGQPGDIWQQPMSSAFKPYPSMGNTDPTNTGQGAHEFKGGRAGDACTIDGQRGVLIDNGRRLVCVPQPSGRRDSIADAEAVRRDAVAAAYREREEADANAWKTR